MIKRWICVFVLTENPYVAESLMFDGAKMETRQSQANTNCKC